MSPNSRARWRRSLIAARPSLVNSLSSSSQRASVSAPTTIPSCGSFMGLIFTRHAGSTGQYPSAGASAPGATGGHAVPPFTTLSGARSALRSGALSAADVLSACLDRMEESEAVVRAWTACDPSGAMDEAGRLDAARRHDLPLWGTPIGVKDIIDVAAMPTTAASRVLAGNVAIADAPVVARLRAAGAVVLGKTNTQEFAYGAVTPGTSNPSDPSRIPGGSSGGSAAALAAGHCLGALGTDTAGSIRIPAALCGVVGLKPRAGRVPLDGIIPLAPSFDVVGPMAGTVADVALL